MTSSDSQNDGTKEGKYSDFFTITVSIHLDRNKKSDLRYEKAVEYLKELFEKCNDFKLERLGDFFVVKTDDNKLLLRL